MAVIVTMKKIKVYLYTVYNKYIKYIIVFSIKVYILCYEGNLPELTDQHILSVFLASGITNGQVNHLGILLGLSRDQLAHLRSEDPNHPAWYAMVTVRMWLDKESLSLKQSYKELEGKLCQCHLNSIVPRLYGKERYTAIGKLKVSRLHRITA